MLGGEEQIGDAGFAFPLQDAVDGALGVLENSGRRERDTVSADKHKDIRPPSLGLLGQVDDLGDVGEVIARKRDHVGPPVVDRLQVTVLALDLEIEQPDLMSGLTRRLRDQLQTERLQAEEDLGVHERAGMHGEQSHVASPLYSIGPTGQSAIPWATKGRKLRVKACQPL